MKNENSRMYGAAKNSARCRATPCRSRWGSKSSVIPILPMGEPIDDTEILCAARMASACWSCSSSRSRTLTPQALRSSMLPIPRWFSTAHCFSKSSSISSANPDSVHMRTVSPSVECEFWGSGGLALVAAGGENSDELPLEDHVQDDDGCRGDQ